MVKEDEEKTVFYTDHETYCYTKMSFGLKNAGAIYQRLVDSAFQSQIGRNLEAYVDDMVIKSRDEKMLLADITKTFDNLKKINMKLNPNKCSFGVKEGKFPGYMVTSKGIRANPKKTKALADLQIRFGFDRAQRHRVHLCSLSHLPSTNNEAECEALLDGLRIARQMNISNIEIDSKLVASQINRTYKASKDSMIRYLAKAKEYVFGFKSFSIENIPRNTNEKADVLSKLASVTFNHLTKEVLVEVLNERSTEN
nr:reverse transcriptase domain-containing protein [Tanacetum cinerariifolium]